MTIGRIPVGRHPVAREQTVTTPIVDDGFRYYTNNDYDDTGLELEETLDSEVYQRFEAAPAAQPYPINTIVGDEEEVEETLDSEFQYEIKHVFQVIQFLDFEEVEYDETEESLVVYREHGTTIIVSTLFDEEDILEENEDWLQGNFNVTVTAPDYIFTVYGDEEELDETEDSTLSYTYFFLTDFVKFFTYSDEFEPTEVVESEYLSRIISDTAVIDPVFSQIGDEEDLDESEESYLVYYPYDVSFITGFVGDEEEVEETEEPYVWKDVDVVFQNIDSIVGNEEDIDETEDSYLQYSIDNIFQTIQFLDFEEVEYEDTEESIYLDRLFDSPVVVQTDFILSILSEEEEVEETEETTQSYTYFFLTDFVKFFTSSDEFEVQETVDSEFVSRLVDATAVALDFVVNTIGDEEETEESEESWYQNTFDNTFFIIPPFFGEEEEVDESEDSIVVYLQDNVTYVVTTTQGEEEEVEETEYEWLQILYDAAITNPSIPLIGLVSDEEDVDITEDSLAFSDWLYPNALTVPCTVNLQDYNVWYLGLTDIVSNVVTLGDINLYQVTLSDSNVYFVTLSEFPANG